MSQGGRYFLGTGALPIETITGNSGGAVGPDGFGNVDITGTTPINIVGNPGTNSLAVSITTPIDVQYGGSGRVSHTAYAVICGGTTTTNPQQSIASVGNAGEVLTSNGAGALPTFQVNTTFGWSVIAGAAQAMVAGNGYFANNAGTVTFTLPATAAVGDTFEVAGMNNATGWSIAQNAGQTIHIGTLDTTTGVGGSLASTATYDWIKIVCNVANTDFVAHAKQGNITVV